MSKGRLRSPPPLPPSPLPSPLPPSQPPAKLPRNTESVMVRVDPVAARTPHPLPCPPWPPFWSLSGGASPHRPPRALFSVNRLWRMTTREPWLLMAPPPLFWPSALDWAAPLPPTDWLPVNWLSLTVNVANPLLRRGPFSMAPP